MKQPSLLDAIRHTTWTDILHLITTLAVLGAVARFIFLMITVGAYGAAPYLGELFVEFGIGIALLLFSMGADYP